MARRTVNAHGVRGGMRRQTPLDRFDEAVGEDERIAAGSFNMDPGMRAPDEFTDVTSEGYNEWAKRAAERGGAKEYATSVEEEEADSEADELRGQLLFALAALGLGGVGGKVANRMLGPGARPGLGLGSRNPSRAEWNAMKGGGTTPPSNAFRRGTLGQVGAERGVGRTLFGTPAARQAAARRGIDAGRHQIDDTLGVLDEAADAMPLARLLFSRPVSGAGYLGATTSPMVHDVARRRRG